MKRTLLAIAATIALRAPLSAQDAQPRTKAKAEVQVVAAGAPATLAAMAERIVALETRLPVVVHWTARAAIDLREIVAAQGGAEPGVLARVWLDMREAERAVLFIANQPRDRFLVRVLDGHGKNPELTRESVATIVESAIDALLAGGQIGVDRSAAVREIETQTGARIAHVEPDARAQKSANPADRALEPQLSARPTPRHRSVLSAHYRGDALADGPALRHGLQLGLSWLGFFEPALDLLVAVTAHYFPPFSLGDPQRADRSVVQHGGGARTTIGATGRVAALFVWQAALGAGLDVARVEPVIAADSGLVAAEPFSVIAPMACAFVSGALRPAAWIEIQLGVGVDLDLSGHHFDVQRGAARTPALSPWRVHPYWLIGIGIPLAGAARP